MSGAWLIIVVVIVFAIAASLTFVSWWYALDDRPQRLDIPTADGWTVAAWFRPAIQRRFGVPVILCHGLANNHAFMEFREPQNLAKYLAAAGFDCYSVDLRGAGASRAPDEGPWDATFDDHVRFDLPALIDGVLAHAGAQQVAWVGHSLGGLLGLAASSTPMRARVSAVVTIGSPLYFKFPPQVRWLTRVARALSVWGQFDATLLRLLAPFAGRAPVAKRLTQGSANVDNIDGLTQRYVLGNVFAPMWNGVLQQLDDWIRHDVFRSVDGSVDYREGVRASQVPTLVIGGSVDKLAPLEHSRALHALLTAPVRELVLVGTSEGQLADYGHGDLVLGRNAHLEVYPHILRFLERNLGGAAPQQVK